MMAGSHAVPKIATTARGGIERVLADWFDVVVMIFSYFFGGFWLSLSTK